MGTIGELALAAGAAWIVSDYTGYDFWIVALAIGALYLLVTQGKGFSGGGIGIFTGIGNMFAGARTFIVSVIVFAGLMMMITYGLQISNSYATNQFAQLGWRFWLWPSGYARDLVMWVSAAFLVAGIAGRAAHGDKRMATIIFGAALIGIFLTTHLPTTRTAIAPTSWPEADTAISDNGVVSVGVTGAGTLLVGQPDDIETSGLLGSSTKRAWRYLFGRPDVCPNIDGFQEEVPDGYYQPDGTKNCVEGTRPTPVPPTTAATSAPATPNVIYGITPTELEADYEFNIEADGPIMVQYPGEKPVEFVPGQGFKQLPQPRMYGPKKFWDRDDPDNGHVAFRLYPVKNRQ